MRKREYRRPLFYSWRFVAAAVASMNGIRCLRFCFWESSLHKFVASSLQVLRISCKLLASSLQLLCKFFAFLVSCLLVLCKFSASSLRSFLRSLCRSSARAAESAGKVRPTTAPKSIQNRANLAQGVGKGYPKINRNIKKVEKT